MKKELEICCFTVESAVKAEKSGADRVELCDNYSEGGTTPSFAAIKHALSQLSIPVNIIVRPRGGDFLYTAAEYEIIKEEISAIKKLNANGVVIGFLKPNGEIDLERTQEIVELAKPMEVTFHRAFDMSREPLASLEQLKETGVKRILTSGSQGTVMEGIDMLAKLVNNAGDDMSIMPGGGVNQQSLSELTDQTNAREFHSAAKKFEDSNMEYFNGDVSMGGDEEVSEYQKVSVNEKKIEAMVDVLETANSI